MLKAEIVADWFGTYGESLSYKKYLDEFKGELNINGFENQKKCFEPIMNRMAADAFKTSCEEDRKELEKWIDQIGKSGTQKKSDSSEKAQGLRIFGKSFISIIAWLFGGSCWDVLRKQSYWKAREKLRRRPAISRVLICQSFSIEKRPEKDLVESYLKQKLRQYDKGQYETIKSEMEWETYFDSFIISPDERDAVCGYVNNQEYEEIKKKCRKNGRVRTG